MAQGGGPAGRRGKEGKAHKVKMRNSHSVKARSMIQGGVN